MLSVLYSLILVLMVLMHSTQSLRTRTSSSRVQLTMSSSQRNPMLEALNSAKPLLGFYAVMLAPVYGTIFGSVTDFKTLENRCGRSLQQIQLCNEYIVAPPKFTTARSNPAPVFDVSADTLEQIADRVIKRQPRMQILPTDESIRRHEYVQRTLLFRFPDVITVQFIPVAEQRSTLAAHSYSIYGASDLGVNSQRIKSWLAEIDTEIAKVTPPSLSPSDQIYMNVL